MIKNLFVIFTTLAIVSCAATQEKRFPLVYEDTQKAQKLDVVIDTIVYSDIEGGDVGFNKEKNALVLQTVEESVKSNFASKGYEVNFVRLGNGLIHTPIENEKSKFVVSVDGKSTGEDWPGPSTDGENDPWVTDEAREYLRKLISHAQYASAIKSTTKTKIKIRAENAFKQQSKPAHLLDLPTGVLGVVHVRVSEVGMDKTVGSALLTGILSAALTGGMYVYSSAPVTGLQYDLVIFDFETDKVLWQKSYSGNGNIKSVANMSTTIFKELPDRAHSTPELSQQVEIESAVQTSSLSADIDSE